MDEIDIPQYFLCPISLQIMKDPVTTITGITYDRESIEHWLSDDASLVCPVTKLPLPRSSGLTPNHMLRRLIQSWCVANADYGVDRIPTPKSPLQRSLVLKLIRDVNRGSGESLLTALTKLDELAVESEKNHACMAEAGVPKAMVLFVLRCFKEGKRLGIEQALRILQFTLTATDENKVMENLDFVRSILWILKDHQTETPLKTHALLVLKRVTEVSNSGLMEKLNLEFFDEMVKILREKHLGPQAVKSVLHILIQTCPPGRNKVKIVETGAVFELIELELSKPEKKTTELIFCLLAHLCTCADGRQQLLKHPAGIAVAAKRLLRNTPATDDWALCVVESIARFSATREVVMEMLRVGAVSKLCMVLQADCGDYLKKKAREILRLHSNAWSNSPCIQVYLLTMNPR